MEIRLWSLWATLAFLTLRVCAQCASYGVDYSNGGSYYIDSSSNQYFTFMTVFNGERFQLCPLGDPLLMTIEQDVTKRQSVRFSLDRMGVSTGAQRSGRSQPAPRPRLPGK